MPKTKPPKLCKNGKHAYVRINGHRHYFEGQWGSAEVKAEYARFELEWWENHRSPIKAPAISLLQSDDNSDTTIGLLVANYLSHVEGTMHKKDYGHVHTAVFDFLLKLYPNTFPVDSFSTKCLKLVRTAMVQSGRFCRKVINGYVKRIVAMFRWGEVEGIVERGTCHALRELPALRKGEQGTFDHAERVEVPDDVVALTLPFLPPVVGVMVQIQGMTGMRPTELCIMRVGDVDQSGDVWKYQPKNHKTEEYIGKKVIDLGKAEQELISPYLIGKSHGQAVFSPAQAMRERNTEKRVNRKSKITPSQVARDAQRAKKPIRYTAFYDDDSYRKAIKYAITAAKKSGVIIPHWTPYQLRHGAGTRAEKEFGLDGAQALLHHTSAQMTKRYAHGRQAITENMARNRRNPFAKESGVTLPAAADMG